jgi:hypothetical protein
MHLLHTAAKRINEPNTANLLRAIGRALAGYDSWALAASQCSFLVNSLKQTSPDAWQRRAHGILHPLHDAYALASEAQLSEPIRQTFFHLMRSLEDELPVQHLAEVAKQSTLLAFSDRPDSPT